MITTKKEIDLFDGNAVAIEDLDDNPFVMKAQILALLDASNPKDLLLGIDPGNRIGLAVFYGTYPLFFQTSNSVDELFSTLRSIANGIPYDNLAFRVGNGAGQVAYDLARRIKHDFKSAEVELVNESGTSVRNPKKKGLTKDQAAASRIAHRRGVPFF